ncbi:cytochrome c oxidase assembly protein [Ammoniphilus sp. YIM 78166]|uniref:cytochrome c oxidase assembly protein n=1 Tax=Ammoniphilus sp. YIM 78166 TaxID=1644106 RepID=UPI00106F8F25|nr:cytochrome c oxidase assembly protein [Ammoniphilus sp. YIM 78166]
MSHNHHNHGMGTSGIWEMWSPYQFVVILVLGFFYYQILKKSGQAVPFYHPGLFLLGLSLYFLCLGSPLNYYGHHYLLSAHMLQQAVLYYIVPPLLILGIPKEIWESLVQTKWISKLMETHMLLTLIAFDILFSLYHLPLVFNTVMTNYPVMVFTHSILFIFAIQMWWPIIGPLPELNQTSELKKMAYILLGAILITPSCALIIFADKPIYEAYFGAPQIFEWLPSMDDQQLGGVLMKFVQELSYGSAIAFIFFRWYKREKMLDADLNGPQER